jgi:hypothetical protein
LQRIRDTCHLLDSRVFRSSENGLAGSLPIYEFSPITESQILAASIYYFSMV